MRRTVPMLSSVFALALLAGCAKEPTAEIAAARQAMDAARVAEAPDYAPEAWAEAEDAQMRLDAELDAQKNAFALYRSYDRATTLAVDAKAASERAATDADAGKATARDEARSAIERAKKLGDEVSRLVAEAPRGKGTVTDIAALRADSAGTDATVKDAEDALAAGRYKDAKSKAEAAVRSLESIRSQIEAATRARGAGHRT